MDKLISEAPSCSAHPDPSEGREGPSGCTSSSPLACPGARLGAAGASLQGGLAETGLRRRLSHQVTQTLQWAVRSWTDLESSIVSVERMKDYARTPKEVTGGRRGGGRVPPGLTAEGRRPRSTSQVDVRHQLWSPHRWGPESQPGPRSRARGLEPSQILVPLLPHLGKAGHSSE